MGFIQSHIINKPGLGLFCKSLSAYSTTPYMHVPTIATCTAKFLQIAQLYGEFAIVPLLYISFEAMPKIIKGLSLHKCAVIKLVCSDKM